MDLNVFVTYSHEDADWLDQVERHIKPLRVNKKVGLFSDRDLKTGDLWEKRIIDSLDSAEAAILLLSPSFFASDFIVQKELPKIVERARSGRMFVFPICIRPCSRVSLEVISDYQFANPPSKALSEMEPAEVDRVLANLIDEISAVSSMRQFEEDEQSKFERELRDSGRKIIENETIKLGSFEGIGPRFNIENHAFINCTIIGPSVVYMDREVQFVSSVFDIDGPMIDAMIFEFEFDGIVGPLILSNVVFFKSRLSGVGIAVHKSAAKEFKKHMIENINSGQRRD